MSPIHIFVAAVLTLACISDLRTRRIPNVLTVSAILAAVLFHALSGGFSAVGWSLAGCLVGAALFLPMFVLRGMGAGDVKLLAASIAGGVVAIAVALGHGYLRTAVRNVWMLLMHWRIMGVRPLESVTLEGARGPRLAYAVPISIGTAVTLWLK